MVPDWRQVYSIPTLEIQEISKPAETAGIF